MLRPIGLDEAPELRVEAAPAHVGVNGGGELTPAIERPFEAELLRALDRAIEGDPRHDLGIGEVLGPPARFPDPFIRLDPDALEVGQKRLLLGPARVARSEPFASRVMERIHHLAEGIELELVMGGIADAHGRGAFVSRQPWQHHFGQPPFAGDPIHDLDLLRAAGDRA